MADVEPLKTGELDSFQKTLKALRGRLRGDLDQLTDETLQRTGPESSGNLSTMPIHLADLGTENFDQELALGVIENEQATLNEIEEALLRIESGRYGLCEACDKPIGRDRLKTLPYARLCINCARESERQSGRSS